MSHLPCMKFKRDSRTAQTSGPGELTIPSLQFGNLNLKISDFQAASFESPGSESRRNGNVDYPRIVDFRFEIIERDASGTLATLFARPASSARRGWRRDDVQLQHVCRPYTPGYPRNTGSPLEQLFRCETRKFDCSRCSRVIVCRVVRENDPTPRFVHRFQIPLSIALRAAISSIRPQPGAEALGVPSEIAQFYGIRVSRQGTSA